MVVTDKKWQCPRCNWSTSRRWNAARHIKLRHGVHLYPIKTEGTPNSFNPRDFQSPKFEKDSLLYRSTDKSEDPLTDLMEWMQKYYIPMKSYVSTYTPPVVPPSTYTPPVVPPSTYTPPVVPPSTYTPPVVPPSTPFYPERVKDTLPTYWNMPISDVRGVSGYYCKSYNLFSLRLIRDIGCDMTEKTKHIGLQAHIDIDTPLHSFAVASLRNALNFIMPGIIVRFDQFLHLSCK
jgi:hypothetical protein